MYGWFGHWIHTLSGIKHLKAKLLNEGPWDNILSNGGPWSVSV